VPLLSQLVSVAVWDKPSRSRFRPPPDVWLHDGHSGPLGVPEPTVVHLQEAPWRHESTRPLYRAKFIDQYEGPSRAAAERAARVITPSESSRQQIIEEYDVDPAHVLKVPLGVDLALFRPGRPGAAALIARAGGDAGRPYVLYVSTVHPRKNLPALRTAMAGLARQGLPHGLVMAVSPPADRDDYQDLLDEAGAELPGAPGRVVLLRGLSDLDLAALMAGATVFCLPSLWEGFGLTALESMACGVPVVVSNRGSLPEVVGDAGVISEPDAGALEAALFALLTDPDRRAQLSSAGLARCLQFSWHATARGWLEALQQAVPHPHLGPFEWLPDPSGRLVRTVSHGVRLPVQRRKWVANGADAGSPAGPAPAAASRLAPPTTTAESSPAPPRAEATSAEAAPAEVRPGGGG
jgi:glycosyltransferase involved in cell wall biosynthesis